MPGREHCPARDRPALGDPLRARAEQEGAGPCGRAQTPPQLCLAVTGLPWLRFRLCVALQDASQLKAEKSRLEQQVTDLQAKCCELEAERCEAVQRARSSLQLLEEASLQRSQVGNHAGVDEAQGQPDSSPATASLSFGQC